MALLEHLEPGMLLLGERGFFYCALWRSTAPCGASDRDRSFYYAHTGYG